MYEGLLGRGFNFREGYGSRSEGWGKGSVRWLPNWGRGNETTPKHRWIFDRTPLTPPSERT